MKKKLNTDKKIEIKDTIGISNALPERVVRLLNDNKEASLLDENYIAWKAVDGKLIGKRSVFTFDFRACWLEDTVIENVKSWWCGKTANYNEIFIK